MIQNISCTAEAHAQMLVSAGFDYVALGHTNWPVVNMNTDVFILRATEVLFEEWKALGSRGIATPAIAVWPVSPKLPAGSNSTWQCLLDHLYNNPLYEELVYKQDGKKVVFISYNVH
ncbi:unnamed protein product [Polarella glacialis]|uniref:Uncharacterized protein n=1 Tax=Polarella glacialis TaxID=89957 RepID=A0A813KVH7_POLGL|nr:unnamed protein product [Polarella glacialis]